MSGKPNHNESASEFLDRLAGFLWQEREGETTEDICRELREEGLDPERMQARVRGLIARVSEERRLAWMATAKQEIRQAQARRNRLDLSSLDRTQLLSRIQASGQIAARGLDTSLEEMGEAELRELCEEIEWATNLDEEAPSSDR
ncbi:MAG: hypothetical protein GX934_00015 [Burkholderiales bacterium]|jgi:hypothetical protein|nr:hypothetical protein [Burkholderiales bacterium]